MRTDMRSCFLQPVTPSPTSSTKPAESEPSTAGYLCARRSGPHTRMTRYMRQVLTLPTDANFCIRQSACALL
jgi:hypothetical protein